MRNPRATARTKRAGSSRTSDRTDSRTDSRTSSRTHTSRRSRIRTALVLLTLAAPLATAAALATGGDAGAIGVPRPTPVERLMESRLTVTYEAAPDALARTYTLDCEPLRATADPACERLVEIGGPERAVPAGQMCSMIYGGPQTARVTGRWRGRPVNEDYSRTNGCEVARWQRMVPALPAATAATGLTAATAATGLTGLNGADNLNSADTSAGGTTKGTAVRS